MLKLFLFHITNGLADESIRPLKHFTLLDEFSGDNVNEFMSGADKSLILLTQPFNRIRAYILYT